MTASPLVPKVVSDGGDPWSPTPSCLGPAEPDSGVRLSEGQPTGGLPTGCLGREQPAAREPGAVSAKRDRHGEARIERRELRERDPLVAASAKVQGLWQQAQSELRAGRLPETSRLLARALRLVPSGDCELADRLECAHAAVLLEIGDPSQRGEEAESQVSPERLRRVLLRSGSALNQHLAAYQLARWFELHREYKKGLFYAGIAIDQARLTGRGALEAWAFNLRGNLLAAESRFDRALSDYREALGLSAEGDEIWVAQIWANIGYCDAVLGRPEQALSILYTSLRRLRRGGADRYLVPTLLALSFTLLEVARPRHAFRHARRALVLAEELKDRRGLVNALYLSGEAAALLGRDLAARGAYRRLGELLGRPELADVLLVTETRSLVNLKA